MHTRRDLSDRWRSLAEAAGLVDPDAAREFPAGVDEPPAPFDLGRREALRLFGASMMLAGVSGCARAPRGKIVPYGVQPPEVTPGVAEAYATAMTIDGYATGLLVESHEGRPTKVEGNPDHPASLGATGVLEQASILSLYDPARAQWLLRHGAPESWRKLGESLVAARGGGGGWEGVHLLLPPTSSPWTGDLLEELTRRGARAHYDDGPGSRVAVWEGTRAVFDKALDPVLDLRAADVIVCLDADLLAGGPFHCRYARQFADGRRVRGAGGVMNRLYAAGPMLTVTSSTADHRLRIKASDVATIAASLLREVSARAPAPWLSPIAGAVAAHREAPEASAWVRAVAKDLAAHAGRSLVVAGDAQPAAVHALVAALNAVLGNTGKTVRYVAPALLEAGTEAHGLGPLVRELDAGRVKTLIVLGGNPVYTAPADLELGRRIAQASATVYLGAYGNETARRCEWLVPLAHYLETWGDARALDGTVSIVQPLIAPLFGGRTVSDVLGLMLDRPAGYEGLVARWASRLADHARAWPAALQRGLLEGTASPYEAVEPRPAALSTLLDGLPRAAGLELVLPLDGKIHDGSFANNAWLLELPDAMTKLTWGNAALVSPATATRLGLATEDVVVLSSAGRSVRAPVFVMPGQADDSIALALGYGREGAEELGHAGVNAYPLRTVAAPYAIAGVTLAKTGETRELATTQEHWSMEHRALARRADLARFRDGTAGARDRAPNRTLYQLKPDAPNQWAMSIDLNACTGCSVCVVACQAENNVPVVGAAGVRKSREMHWLRVDRYFSGSVDDPEVDTEPMACQHCEKAPCEYVCPVGATVHSPDGLNEMVYNRCVGTRFCSNNCPYKVRRFNWFDYNRDKSAPLRMLMNPDVTVRARGVMEKCSYCVQRIREAEIGARKRGVDIADGVVQTACQKACPSQAIAFGSVADPRSLVSRLHADPRSYKILDELGTEPRTRYMLRLKNPNPELAG